MASSGIGTGGVVVIFIIGLVLGYSLGYYRRNLTLPGIQANTMK